MATKIVSPIWYDEDGDPTLVAYVGGDEEFAIYSYSADADLFYDTDPEVGPMSTSKEFVPKKVRKALKSAVRTEEEVDQDVQEVVTALANQFLRFDPEERDLFVQYLKEAGVL